MKNFSAKNAEFETVTINNEAAITSADIGTAPNKIPLNKDLGSLAYQDAVNLDDVSADMIELRAIAAEISDSAVDVFVYDTSRDSDGGAWRKRVQHTSWYNEELNTATRGARREFPAVAVIVAEASKVTIYDGDDPDMGMWMVFNVVSSMNLITNSTVSSVTALNGIVGVACNGSNPHFTPIDFISEKSGHYTTFGNKYFLFDISKRNNTSSPAHGSYDGTVAIVNSFVNDVAMTVLPNAPIDEDTGLPVPTIAVATDGGVSVIKDDGSVVDIVRGTGSSLVNSISFDDHNKLIINNSGTGACYYNIDIPGADLVQTEFGGYTLFSGSIPASNDNLISGSKVLKNYVGHANSGLNILEKGLTDQGDGMIAYTTSKYNTGWMPGDIKLATLSDTTVENIGVNSDELVTNAGFSADSDWTKGDGWTISGASALHIAGTAGDIDQSVSLLVGQAYTIIVNITDSDLSEFYFKLDDGNYIQIEGSPVGVHSYTFIASESIQNVGARGGVNWDGTIDNISVRATTELITNGDFSRDSDWEKSDHWTISSETAVMTSTSEYKPLYQYDLNMISGKKYVATIDVSAITGEIKFDTAAIDGSSISEFDGIIISSTGTHSLTFVAESDQDGIGVARRSSSSPASCTVNSISVRPAVDDRSVNGNGLQIVGAIDKTQVAPGTDLVAYSGFSTNNYLVQPYNEDLDFGTGDFCVTGWFKNANDNALLLARLLPQLYNTSGTDRGFLISFGSNGVLSFATYTAGFQPTGRKSVGSQDDMSGINNWTHFVAVRDGGVMKLYINAIKQTSEATNSDDISDDTASIPLSVGCFNEVSANRFTGSTALLRISKTAPTPEQIAKIYRDEKPLFQDGAQATLYGTSDAVTALAYDDSNQLLHVGTASGRSDFRGLVRVNNTTTAISNSISATEGLVIEQ